MNILVVGARGYLGGEVARQASAAGHTVHGPSSTELNVTDRAAVQAAVAALRPDAVVNCAARIESWAVCGPGAANVAWAARGARLVHLSSDAVHSGRAEPYQDQDDPTPVHMYGAAKAAAETAVAAIDPSAAIVRTSLIVGDDRSKQVTMSLDMATGRRPGTLHTDEIRCPIAVRDLAAAVLELAAGDYAGLLNVAGAQPISRAEMGRLIAARHGLDPDSVPTGTIAGSGLGARPARVVLDSSRATALLTTAIHPPF